MIAAPSIRVVLEHLCRERAQNRLPSSAIPAIVTDKRIRTRARIWSLIGFAGQIDSGNYLRTILGITNLQKPLPDLAQQRVGLSRIDNTFALPSAHVQIESVQAQPISSCAAPIDIREGLARIRTGAFLTRDVAIVQQPGIQIEGVPVRSKSVVR